MNDKIRVLCGDCVDVLRGIESNSVDLIIADPPYNLGKDYGNLSDIQIRSDYLEFCKKWIIEAHRVLKNDGTMYVFMGFRFISHVYQILEDTVNMHFNAWICWHYTQGLGKTKGFSPRHDDILMFSKSKNNKFNIDEIRIPQKYYRKVNNMRGANPGYVWQFSHVHYCNENRQSHPTQKPEGIIERMVLASSDEGDFVLDPFSGSGTTLRVCQQLNRKVLGIEINSDYVNMTIDRLAKPFSGFDSIDERMERVPFDLNDPLIRNEYFLNHIKWFLKNHENATEQFWKNVKEIYGDQSKGFSGDKLSQLSIWS